MPLDHNVFFREATLRICGSLQAERLLGDSFDYIRHHIPVDRVYLTHYFPDKGEHAVLAAAPAGEVVLKDARITMPLELRPFLARLDTQTLVIDRAEDHPTAQPWISQGYLDKDSSLLINRLISDREVIGGLVFVAQGEKRFTPQHAELASLLREPFAIALSNCVHYLELLELKDLLAEDCRYLQQDLLQAAGGEIVGADFGLKGVMEMVRRVAPLNSPVLLLGETGTGKELIAAAIHNLSQRREGPFIRVNCGAIPEGLMDSELFGHEKGAFTGAIEQKRGRFERANRGTIFLDEVGELRPEAQVRLLRVLQEKEIERVGGTGPVKVDIRVIAATHRDLEIMLREGTFREDLYFRLKVFPILIPPLRERRGDIPSLVQYFVRKKGVEMGLRHMPSLAKGDLDRLMSYSWPGNIRELENTVERSIILSRDRSLTFNDLDAPERQQTAFPSTKIMGHERKLQIGDMPSLDQVISKHIQMALEISKGKVGGEGGAAIRLGVNPSTLRKRMRKLGIPFGRKAVRRVKKD